MDFTLISKVASALPHIWVLDEHGQGGYELPRNLTAWVSVDHQGDDCMKITWKDEPKGGVWGLVRYDWEEDWSSES